MCSQLIYLILLSCLSFCLIEATDFNNCCRYGFEDGVKLNMLKDTKNWSVIRTQNFNYCESRVYFGRDAFRRCKMLGEEMALNCKIGKYYSLLGFDCDTFRNENPTTYACCLTCSNGQRFAEEEFELFQNKSGELGEELFKNEHLYSAILNQVDKDIEKQCKLLNLVYIIPELQLSTFDQCCRGWNYNFNQNFYPDHFNLKDTCDRINICLDKQNHTKFSVPNANKNELIKLKTDNLMKILRALLKLEDSAFDDQFDEVFLNRSEDKESSNLKKVKDLSELKEHFDARNRSVDFHRKNPRSIEDEKRFHSNISLYELNLRRVPTDKFKYHYCNKMCKDTIRLDYNESFNRTASNGRKRSTQCFHNYSEKFCARPIECNMGFFPNHNNTICVKLDECAQKLDDCLTESEYCVKHYEGYACECREGYRFDLSTKKCINIDECTEEPRICPTNSYCKDVEGSFECNCYEGLFKNEYGQCTPFLTRLSDKSHPKKIADNSSTNKPTVDPIYFSSTADQVNEDEAKTLAEKLKYEKENLIKLKKGQLADRQFLSEDAASSTTDRMTIGKKSINSTIENQTISSQSTNDQLITESTSEQPINNVLTDNESILSTTVATTNIPITTVETRSPASIEDQTLKPESKQNIPTTAKEDMPKASSVKLDQNEINDQNVRDLNTETNLKANNLIEKICGKGFKLSSKSPIECIDIDECADSKLNNCNKLNETCINVPGNYQCKLKDECQKGYRDINVNLYTNDQHHYEQSTRTSTNVFVFLSICKYEHSRPFENDEQRREYEKTNSIIQYIIYETISLPFSNGSNYVLIPKDRTLSRTDAGRLKAKSIPFYLVDKSRRAEELNLDFIGDLKIKSSNCTIPNNDLNEHFKLIELDSNVFAVALLKAIKEPCTIDFNLDIQTKFTTQNSNFNRELFKIQLIIYQIYTEFTITGNLKSECLKNNQSKIC